MTHEVELTDNLLLESEVNVSYSSEYYTASDLDKASEQGAYAKVGLRISLTDINDDAWRVSLQVRNLTDETILRASQDLPAHAFAYWGSVDPGRSVSISAQYNF